MFKPCLRAVATTERKAAKSADAFEGAKGAGDLHLDLHHPQSCSARLLVKGTAKS
jgi:hypothetical protein